MSIAHTHAEKTAMQCPMDTVHPPSKVLKGEGFWLAHARLPLLFPSITLIHVFPHAKPVCPK